MDKKLRKKEKSSLKTMSHNYVLCFVVIILDSCTRKIFDVHNQCKHVTVFGQSILFHVYVYIVQETMCNIQHPLAHAKWISTTEGWDEMLE